MTAPQGAAALRNSQPPQHVHIVGENCPWCDQPIPPEKFEEINGRIRAKERDRALDVERRIKEQVAVERAQAEARARVDIENVRKEGAAAVEKAKEEAAKREADARVEARRVAEAASAAKVAEAEQARKAAEQKLQTAKVEQENMLIQRLKEQRDALEKANAEAVNAERAKAFTEKLKFEEKLQEMTRQLQQKSAEELGEGAELDLFEDLKTEFPEDKISRVDKGTAGADIIHKVVNNGKICGCIIYDSKNRNAWRNDYVTKLRKDQLAASADHAILSTHIFPTGARQIHIQDGVLIANPARVIALVELLRKQIVQIHGLRLSNDARDQKTTQLYEFITSDRSTQLLDHIEVQTDDMLELEIKEKKAHDANWRKRGELIRSVQRARADFTSEIDRIIGTAADGDQQ